jgi:hypothetical protein
MGGGKKGYSSGRMRQRAAAGSKLKGCRSVVDMAWLLRKEFQKDTSVNDTENIKDIHSPCI